MERKTGTSKETEESRAVAGEMLKSLRVARGLTLRSIGRFDATFLSRIEKGKIPVPESVVDQYLSIADLSEQEKYITNLKINFLLGRIPTGWTSAQRLALAKGIELIQKMEPLVSQTRLQES